MYLLAICMVFFFFWEMPIQVLCLFFNWVIYVFTFLLWGSRNSLHILEIHPLSDIWLTNTVFYLWLVRLLIFLKINIPNFHLGLQGPVWAGPLSLGLIYTALLIPPSFGSGSKGLLSILYSCHGFLPPRPLPAAPSLPKRHLPHHCHFTFIFLLSQFNLNVIPIQNPLSRKVKIKMYWNWKKKKNSFLRLH